MMAICNVSSYHEGSSCQCVLVSKPEPVSFRVEKGSDKQVFFPLTKIEELFFLQKYESKQQEQPLTSGRFGSCAVAHGENIFIIGDHLLY